MGVNVDHPPDLPRQYILSLDRLHSTLHTEQSFVQQQFKADAGQPQLACIYGSERWTPSRLGTRAYPVPR